MNITIYAKKRTTKEGKKFYTYLTTLTRKDGVKISTAVKFADCDAPKVEECPCNIVVDKEKCNLATRDFIDRDGMPNVSHTLWVKGYTMGEPYVDRSMDDFE